MYFNLEIILRFLFAVVFGGVVGFERAGTKHEAGLRTHILVCLGAATVMVLSEIMVEKYGIQSEVLRMGAQVISGVGFLGAGSIISDGNKVRGVTTAAGVWTTACAGLVIGAGYYLIALSLLALILVAIVALKPLRRKISSKSVRHTIKIELDAEKRMSEVIKAISDSGIEIAKVKNENDDNSFKSELEILASGEFKTSELICIISACEGVKEIKAL